jgi:dCMP deaminase
MASESRLTWEEYFLMLAKDVSERSTCFRTKCGAIIVDQGKYIVSTGYNGAPQHMPNCKEIGWCYRDKHGIESGTQLERCRACGSHAESNAVAIAARLGHATDGCWIYLYGKDFICTQCRGILANAGITKAILIDSEGNIKRFTPSKDWKSHPVDDEEG